jgi:hypothetical protein
MGPGPKSKENGLVTLPHESVVGALNPPLDSTLHSTLQVSPFVNCLVTLIAWSQDMVGPPVVEYTGDLAATFEELVVGTGVEGRLAGAARGSVAVGWTDLPTGTSATVSGNAGAAPPPMPAENSVKSLDDRAGAGVGTLSDP